MSNMDGRVCVVTGATQGIGLATARGLSRLGARVVLHGRDPARVEAAVAAARAEGGGAVEGAVADLSLVQGARDLAADLRARLPRLDVLINNAGAIYLERHVTADGLELTFALNHLAAFVLTAELLPLLEASGAPGARARIITVASAAHRDARLDLEDVNVERRRYRGIAVYGTSKLMNILFTYELARRLEGKPVVANCLHPGVVSTGYGLNERTWFRLLMKLVGPFLLTPEQGARTSVYLASSPEVEGVSGKYFYRERPVRSRRASHDRESARRLWELSERLAGAAQHPILDP